MPSPFYGNGEVDEKAYAEWLAEVEKEMAEEQARANEWAAKMVPLQAAYVAKYPNYCKTCGGFGVHCWEERHDAGYPGEPMSEPCDACTGQGICARCGEKGLDEDGNGPCTHCGWNYDDDGYPGWGGY